jgi:molecular chaperone HtpG
MWKSLPNPIKKALSAVRWECDGSTEYRNISAEKEGRDRILSYTSPKTPKNFSMNTACAAFWKNTANSCLIEIEFEDKVINNPNPIWTKNPADLKDEDYLAFYKELYPFGEDPLFWIHLNVDYPFNLTGVLYFPKLRNDFSGQREKIQLYSRQVFITDEVKDIVPDFLQLLHGVIDSPDIPLNVSRSYLTGGW